LVINFPGVSPLSARTRPGCAPRQSLHRALFIEARAIPRSVSDHRNTFQAVSDSWRGDRFESNPLHADPRRKSYIGTGSYRAWEQTEYANRSLRSHESVESWVCTKPRLSPWGCRDRRPCPATQARTLSGRRAQIKPVQNLIFCGEISGRMELAGRLLSFLLKGNAIICPVAKGVRGDLV
jgi:hypothetical protein